MDCDQARDAISAMLDGEPPGMAVADVDEHLAGCANCRSWQERAHELTRRFRLQPEPAPRPTNELLVEVTRARSASPRRFGSTTLPRVALAAVAVAQLVLWVPVLLFGHDHLAPIHVAHEMGSFDVALAVGFLVAVRRPARAMGMLSLTGVAAALLVITAAAGLALGHTSVPDEAPHLLVVAGWMLLRRLAVLAPPSMDRPRVLQAVAVSLRASFHGGPRPTPRETLPVHSPPSEAPPAASARLTGAPEEVGSSRRGDRRERAG